MTAISIPKELAKLPQITQQGLKKATTRISLFCPSGFNEVDRFFVMMAIARGIGQAQDTAVHQTPGCPMSGFDVSQPIFRFVKT
jgi:hypothetical protein